MSPQNRKKAIPKELGHARRALASAGILLRDGDAGGAISRAYYCAFHAARAALLTVGVQPRTNKGVNERFNMDLVAPGVIETEYMSMLGRTQTQRELADYSVEVDFTTDQAKEEIELARRFLDRIERFLGDGGWLSASID